MHLKDFNSSIKRFISFITNVRICNSVIYEIKMPRSERFNKVCVTSYDYVKIYDEGLSLSHYNVLLNDLAYFQFSYESETEYSLAYYPNPRLSGSTEALRKFRELEDERDNGALTAEEFDELASGMPALCFIPRIRFEYSEKQYKEVKHPGAHFHIGMSGEDRWCSARALSPESFGLLMVKSYYPDIWWQGSRFSLHKKDQPAALSTCFDEQLLRSIKGDGVSLFLSEYERMGFHFAALQAQAADIRA